MSRRRDLLLPAAAFAALVAVAVLILVLLALIPTLPVKWRHEAKSQINYAINQLPHDAKVTVSKYIEPKLDRLIFEPPPAISLVVPGRPMSCTGTSSQPSKKSIGCGMSGFHTGLGVLA